MSPPPVWILVAAGIAILSFLPTRLFQEANPDWRFVSWGFATSTVILTLIALLFIGGAPWLKHFFVPIGFLILAVPWPTGLENLLIQTLTKFVAALSVEMLNWAGILARQRGNLIELPTGIVGINEACSGVRSFQSTLMISVFLGELYRFSWRRRASLFAAGTVIAFSLNVGRAFFLTLHCAKNGVQAASALHDPAGYLVFGLSFAALLGACFWIKRGQPTAPSSAPATPIDALRPFPLKFLIAVGVWLVLVEVTTETWYRLHERSTTNLVAWGIQWPESAQQFRLTPLSENVQQILRYSTATSANWRQADGSDWLLYFFRWEPGRSSAQLAKNHSPEICLPAAGLKLVKDLGEQSIRVQDLNIPFHSYQFESRGQLLHVFFCIWEDRRRADSARGEEDFSHASRVRAVLDGRRHLGQQVLEIAIGGYATPEAAQRQLAESLQKLIVISRPGS